MAVSFSTCAHAEILAPRAAQRWPMELTCRFNNQNDDSIIEEVARTGMLRSDFRDTASLSVVQRQSCRLTWSRNLLTSAAMNGCATFSRACSGDRVVLRTRRGSAVVG